MAKCKSYRLKKQVSYDNGLNWQDVIPYEYIQGAEYEYHSTDCGYVGNLERWINSGTTCEGYDKYSLQVKQTSTDGINWVTTEETQLGSLIELNSEDCGYVASNKLKLTYNDSTEYDINCNESSELTNSEVSGGTNPISAITSAEIGDCVTSISRAFSGCTNMTVCNIPNSVTSIGESAFSWCSGLTSINIPNSITTIGSYAFLNCSGLTSIEIPNSVTSIGSNAFNNCSSLTEIMIYATTPPTLGRGVFNNTSCPIYVPCESVNTYKNATNWSDYASRIHAIPNSCPSDLKFKAWYSDSTTYSAECDASSALTTADTRAHTTAYSAMTSAIIGDCVTSIGLQAFRNCSGLTSIEIPNTVTTIGDRAFQQCISLTSIDIPSGVTSIGLGAFQSCTHLTSIDIPNSVTSIGNGAFYKCSSLTEIKIYASTPPTLATGAFDNTNNCPIYVPAASVNTYKAASGWSDYASRIQAIP